MSSETFSSSSSSTSASQTPRTPEQIRREFYGMIRYHLQQGVSTVSLDTSDVLSIFENLSSFFEKRKEPIDVALFLGVAYDTLYVQRGLGDRHRFKQGVRHLVNNQTGRDRLIISLDSNFTIANIATTLLTLIDGKMYPDIDITMDPTKVYYTISLLESVMKLEREKTNAALLESQKKLRVKLKNVPLFKAKVQNEDGESSNIYFLFLNHKLTSEHRNNIFNRTNFLEIQRGKKTIKDFLEDPECQYSNNTIYKGFETLATKTVVNNVYIASSLSSHTKDPIFVPISKTVNGKEQIIEFPFRPDIKTSEFGEENRWWVDNRYLRGICELLTCMKKIADAGKSVFFIQIDRLNPTFAHSSVAVEFNKNSNNTYEVPFLNNTTFNKSNPHVAFKPIKRGGGSRKRRVTKKQKHRGRTRKHK